MEAKIGISPEHMAEVAHSLSRILADEYVLYTKKIHQLIHLFLEFSNVP